MSLSDYVGLELLDHLLGVGAYPMPTVYLALCTANPTDAGTGASMNEHPDSDGYARVALAAAFGTPAASGAISNDDTISFPEATGTWTTVTHFAILDSGTHGEGNMLFYGELTVSKTFESGQIPTFSVGQLELRAS